MGKGTRTLALAIGVVVGVSAVVVATTLLQATPRAEASPAADGELVGAAYAKKLGLPVIPKLSADCTYAVQEPADHVLYCMDGFVKDEWDARLLGIRIGGARLPIDLDFRLIELEQELESIPDTPENAGARESVVTELLRVRALLDDATS